MGADWNAFSALKLWLQGDGSTNGATIQVVAKGAYFEYNVGLSDTSGEEISAPFTELSPRLGTRAMPMSCSTPSTSRT